VFRKTIFTGQISTFIDRFSTFIDWWTGDPVNTPY